MLLRRRYMGEKGRSIPYQRIEYLGFTGTQRINLNFGIGTSNRVIVDAVSSVATTGSKILVGVSTPAANWFGCAGVYWGVGTAVGATSNISATTRMTADITFGTNIITGTVNNVYIERSGTPSLTVNFALSNGDYPFEGNVYSCQFYYGNSIICNLVPVRVEQIGYMYDTVSGELFGNAGTGDFVLGPDIN